MSQDRAPADSFPATQELLAYRLGLRCVTTTTATATATATAMQSAAG